MNETYLSPRLQCAADMLGNLACIADIGTDHGYIPVYLASNNRSQHIIAADIKAGPLDSARRNAQKKGVSEKIEFMQTDGLSGMENYSLDGVIIAGMGGETIISILSTAPWVRDQRVRLVLQPMTKIGELSIWLYENGYRIDDEKLVLDKGRLYPVMLVQPGTGEKPSDAEIYVGSCLLNRRDPFLTEYLDWLIESFSKRLEGMEMSKQDSGKEYCEHTRRALKGFLKMKEEIEKW